CARPSRCTARPWTGRPDATLTRSNSIKDLAAIPPLSAPPSPLPSAVQLVLPDHLERRAADDRRPVVDDQQHALDQLRRLRGGVQVEGVAADRYSAPPAPAAFGSAALSAGIPIK